MGEGTPSRSEIIDPLLWRDAQLMLGRHAEPGYDNRCVWCGFRWPCPARRLAERALAAACRPYRGVNGHRPDVDRTDGGTLGTDADAFGTGGDAYRAGGDAYRTDGDVDRHGYRANGRHGRRDGREATGTAGVDGAGAAGWNEPARDGGSGRRLQWRAPRPAGWSDTRPDGWDEERSRAWTRTLPAGWNDTDADGRAVSGAGAGAVGSPVSVPAARDADEEHLVGSG
ncbi:MAG TPA: hypothetical protein VKY81_10620 [Natronosporangium sp.]|nr:hypothetical protein [Natronosporangium sp.]